MVNAQFALEWSKCGKSYIGGGGHKRGPKPHIFRENRAKFFPGNRAFSQRVLQVRQEKGTQTQTFWSGYLRVGRGSSTSRGGGQKVRHVFRNPGKPNFLAGYPGIFAGISPGVPEKFEEKSLCSIFRPLSGGGTQRGTILLHWVWLWPFRPSPRLDLHHKCDCRHCRSKNVWEGKGR